MNRIEAKEFYPILQAFAEGRVIECRTKPSFIEGSDVPNDWTEMKEIEFWKHTEYRIKPETKYRPFKDAKECWQEMQKHQPVGWVKQINDKGLEVFIHCGVIKRDWILTDVDEEPFPFDKIYNNYTFVDGTPFGVKMEE
jgi:hypothetical protein